MLPVFISKSLLTSDQLYALPKASLSREWNGAGTFGGKVAFLLAADPKTLFLVAEFAKSTAAKPTQNGKFIEGLWEEDVIEVFLADDQGQGYQELELSPTGAWWSAIFSAPRVRRQQDLSKVSVICSSTDVAGIHQVLLAYPRNALGVTFGFSEQSRANICACLGKGARQYLSYCPLSGTTPDFHRPNEFWSLMPLELSVKS